MASTPLIFRLIQTRTTAKISNVATPYRYPKKQTLETITKRQVLLLLPSSSILLFSFPPIFINTKAAAAAAEAETSSLPLIYPKKKSSSSASASASASISKFLDFFRMTVPDQTFEEAMDGIRDHAKGLVQVKELLESESWKEAQKELRKSSSALKQDIYTIIQGKPGKERPHLRNLYSVLFNSVTALDYAARDKDVTRVWESYGDILVALNDILSRIL